MFDEVPLRPVPLGVTHRALEEVVDDRALLLDLVVVLDDVRVVCRNTCSAVAEQPYDMMSTILTIL